MKKKKPKCSQCTGKKEVTKFKTALGDFIFMCKPCKDLVKKAWIK